MCSPGKKCDESDETKTDREILGVFLRSNKVLYKTEEINIFVLNQLYSELILRYGIVFLWAKDPYAATHRENFTI